MNASAKRKIRIIDLSVPLLQSSNPLSKVEIQYVSHKEGGKLISSLLGLKQEDFPEGNCAASENIALTSHSGTHLDAPWHFWPTSEGKPAKTVDQVPLEWLYGDGVVLDFTHKAAGEEISIEDVEKALRRIGYQLAPFDIVFVMTGASKYYDQQDYARRHPGVSREATLWIIDRGIKVMGIDAWGWDKPIDAALEEFRRGDKGKLWAAHFAGKEKEYCHLENLTNLEKIPRPYGFKVAVFPIKIPGASAGWVRAVAIV
jgi:kynurenine formamidase